VICCTRECYKHSYYQCKHNSDPIIASYWKTRLLCHDIKQVEKYITYIGAHELDSLINKKLETSQEARMMKWHLDVILQICIDEFSDNAYVIKYKKRTLAVGLVLRFWGPGQNSNTGPLNIVTMSINTHMYKHLSVPKSIRVSINYTSIYYG
jgi:hypothetical protein